MAASPNECPEDFPRTSKLPWGLGKLMLSYGYDKTEVIDIEKVDAELKEVKARLKSFEDTGNQRAGVPNKFTGTCFVIFSKPSDCSKVLQSYQQGAFWRAFRRVFGRFFGTQFFWEWERAPEPSDISWENLGISTQKRIVNSLSSFGATAVLIVLCFLVNFAIEKWQNEIEDDESSSNLYVNTLAIIGTLIVFITNSLLLSAVRRFSIYEQHETRTKMNVSVAFKLTITRFLNSSIVLMMINRDASQWFKSGKLAYEATILITLMALIEPLEYLANIPGWIKWFTIKQAKKEGQDCKLTQREAHHLFEKPEVDMADNVANFLNLVMTCLFYSPIVPLAIPLCCVGCILNYWIYKYMLLRRHRLPEMCSELMALFPTNFMQWILFTWAIAFMVFFSKIKSA